MLLQTIAAAIVAVAPINVERDAQEWGPTLYEHLTNSVADYA